MTLLDPVTDLPDDAIVAAEALIEEARERQRRRRRLIAGCCAFLIGIAAFGFAAGRGAFGGTVERAWHSASSPIGGLLGLNEQPRLATELAMLTPHPPHSGEAFSDSVGFSGKTAVVGSWYGAAYVFSETSSGWRQTAVLTDNHESFGSGNDGFGYKVAISGTTVFVSALRWPAEVPGLRVYVFEESRGHWDEVQVLDAPRYVTEFGMSLAISGNTAAVGGNEGYGVVCVYRETVGRWRLTTVLSRGPGGNGDVFGSSVGLSGKTLVAAYGAVTDGVKVVGRAYVFVRTGTRWHVVAAFGPCESTPWTAYAWSVAVSGRTIVVGAPSFGGVNDPGYACVYSHTAGAWRQSGALRGTDTCCGDGFGYSVAVSRAIVVVGAPQHDLHPVGSQSADIGEAFAFALSRNGWHQAYLLRTSISSRTQLGGSVAISGSDALVGGMNPVEARMRGVGKAWVFHV